MRSILSVGIDIGTSTTQVVFSRLTLENESSYFNVPKVLITHKEILFKSQIYLTPFLTDTLIDADAIENIVAVEFKKAGVTPQDTDTGAVIITGETARKENAESVLNKLSGYAGDFVVSTAGPDLEAIIAGQGSRAQTYSAENSCDVVNIDIGGGTSNIAYFSCGRVISTACLDIGGRQIVVNNGLYRYISPSAKAIAGSLGINISNNEIARETDIRKITDRMAQLLWELLTESESSDILLSQIRTKGSNKYIASRRPFLISFSGGVADFIYNPQKTLYSYNDIGEALGFSIRYSSLYDEGSVVRADETIRATVIGAGMYTTTLSGSTVFFTENTLPIKNIPVLKLSDAEEQECFFGAGEKLASKMKWFLSQNDSDILALSLRGKKSPTFVELSSLAKSIAFGAESTLEKNQTLIVIIENDMAKALGHALRTRLTVGRKYVCLDGIDVSQGDYIDMGKPLMEGVVVPVVVKTLIFG